MTISRGGSSAGDLDRDEAPGHLALPPTAPPQLHTRADAEGVLDLGPWQAVFYCEFDGRRSKRLVIKVIGE